MKGCMGRPISGETHEKITSYMRKHRKSGGEVESPSRGDDDAEKDLKDKPARYNQSKVEDEAEATKAKRGGKMVKAEGKMARHHAGRKKRASGGGCEANPFTSANKGSAPKGHSVEKESMGRDE